MDWLQISSLTANQPSYVWALCNVTISCEQCI